MHKTRMIAACGAALSILSAGALAQSGQPERTQPDRTRDRLTTTPGTSQADSILNRLEGVWRVDVRVSPELMKKWDKKSGSDGAWQERPDDARNRERENSNPDRNDPNRTNPDRNNPDRTNPDRTTPSSGTLSSAPVRLHGVAEASMIMEGNVLRERLYITADQTGLMKSPDSTPGTSTPSRTTPEGGSVAGIDPFQVLMFLAVNDSPDTYSIAIMNSCDGKMHVDTGRYDTSSNKISFEGQNAGKNDRGTINRTPGTTRPGNDPANRGTEPGNDRLDTPDRRTLNTSHDGNVRVVLETMGSDKYRVTMYGGTGTMRPASPNDSSRTSTDTLADGVIYQATYTRVSGTEERQLRDMLKTAAEAGESRHASSPTDRDDGR